MTAKLSLAELEPLSCSGTSRLLPLDCSGIAREQAKVAQLATIVLVDLHQRPRDRESQRTGLTGRATALHIRAHVVPAERVSRRERLLNGADQRRPWEVVSQRPTVHVPFARTRAKIDPAHRFLTAADRMNVLRVRHDYFSSLLKVSGVGC